MAEIHGEFSDSIIRLNDGLKEVKTVWKDQTALTYDQINENMERFTIRVWECYTNSLNGYEAVKRHYNESEMDDKLNQLNAKISSV